MEISGDHHFKAPRELVYQMMLEPDVLRAALPGCESFTEIAPGSYDLVIKVGMAAIKGTYSGNVRVQDRVEYQSYRLVVSGSGKPGSVQGDAVMALSDEPGGTLVKYTGDVKAQGAIARMGSRILGGAARLMIGQFMKAMEKQIEAVHAA
jgi:carbon monoxide dehydrogenase subunit G